MSLNKREKEETGMTKYGWLLELDYRYMEVDDIFSLLQKAFL